MKILFCNDVDEGGSANYVYNMADECKKRGHTVEVLTETGDISILDDKWDLVIVHGMADWQNKCIHRAHPNKLLWLAIRPTYTEKEYKAMKKSVERQQKKLRLQGRNDQARKIGNKFNARMKNPTRLQSGKNFGRKMGKPGMQKGLAIAGGLTRMMSGIAYYLSLKYSH